MLPSRGHLKSRFITENKFALRINDLGFTKIHRSSVNCRRWKLRLSTCRGHNVRECFMYDDWAIGFLNIFIAFGWLSIVNFTTCLRLCSFVEKYGVIVRNKWALLWFAFAHRETLFFIVLCSCKILTIVKFCVPINSWWIQ